MFIIGQRIKELRELAKLESKDLAGKINVSASYMSLLENNKRPCSLERVESICKALGITLGDFFNTKENEKKTEETIILEEIRVNKDLAELITVARKMSKEKLHLVISLCKNLK